MGLGGTYGGGFRLYSWTDDFDVQKELVIAAQWFSVWVAIEFLSS